MNLFHHLRGGCINISKVFWSTTIFHIALFAIVKSSLNTLRLLVYTSQHIWVVKLQPDNRNKAFRQCIKSCLGGFATLMSNPIRLDTMADPWPMPLNLVGLCFHKPTGFDNALQIYPNSIRLEWAQPYQIGFGANTGAPFWIGRAPTDRDEFSGVLHLKVSIMQKFRNLSERKRQIPFSGFLSQISTF